jgi:hypothetical protein
MGISEYVLRQMSGASVCGVTNVYRGIVLLVRIGVSVAAVIDIR